MTDHSKGGYDKNCQCSYCGVTRYYERCARESHAAWNALCEARATGADYQTIQRLQRAWEYASHTGD